MQYDSNPFLPEEKDRYQIWEKVVRVDIDAFLAEDWSYCAGDFCATHFIGIDAQRYDNPDRWKLTYPSLDAYKEDWLRQAKTFAAISCLEDKREALFRATILEEIEIRDGAALLHKKFKGQLTQTDGKILPINWQTLYKMHKMEEEWKITGFVGYMPYPMGEPL